MAYVSDYLTDYTNDEFITRHNVVSVLEGMLEQGNFTSRFLYDFICEYWSLIENGYDLEELCEYLIEFRYCSSCCVELTKQLKKQLKKQMDTDGYLTIFRGFNHMSREDGNSFTLSKAKAIWFANRYASMGKEKGYVNKYKIHISDVLAFITDRKEAEIVAWPDDVILLEQINY